MTDAHVSAPAVHDGAPHGDGAPIHATLSGYLTGFALSVALTAIPFWLAMRGGLDNKQVTALVIVGFAFVQIVVHMLYFLHMDARSEGGWTLMALIFTLVLLAIALSGTLWVMYHLNVNMMPGMQNMIHKP
jgi:cytochrome o ubiquinol oxidase operon protein cyoD